MSSFSRAPSQKIQRAPLRSRGALTARPIVLRNNQDHIGLSRIKNINFKLSRWHRSTVADNVLRPRRRWLHPGDQWRRSL